MAFTLSTTERFLADRHDVDPGLTSRAFGALPVMKGEELFASSYRCLADVVPRKNEPIAVLDLACGDGFLLSLLADRLQPGLSLIGVDISEGELEAATGRLGGAAHLYRSRAQALPLAPASVDYVLCHMSLMLLEDVETAITEVRRVLGEGGIFSAVLGAGPSPSVAFEVYASLLSEFPRRPELHHVRFGDQRTRTYEGLCALLERSFDNLLIEDISVRRYYTLPELWFWFSGMYDLHLLTDDNRQAMCNRYLAVMESHCNQEGQVEYVGLLRQVTAT